MRASTQGILAKTSKLLNWRTWSASSQLELPISRPMEKDRNHDFGGRSFYFFDFDDNVAFLATPSYIFHKETGVELELTSGEFAQIHMHIGKQGPYQDYQVDLCDQTGSFRCFRDQDQRIVDRLIGRRQSFVRDLAQALTGTDLQWKGPSWACFYHAAYNGRPLSIITARGHAPETLAQGVDLFVKAGHIPAHPNYLSLFPVNHRPTRRKLGDHRFELPVADLKKAAIRASVEKALRLYGANPYHRFGMSDDDPKNIQLILEAMKQLKTDYPENSFFVIDTQHGQFIKHEVVHNRVEDELLSEIPSQLKLF